jgi:hypothetical protein
MSVKKRGLTHETPLIYNFFYLRRFAFFAGLRETFFAGLRATFFALPAFLTAFAGAAFAGGVGAAPNLRAPEITSFNPFAGRKRTFLLALI